MIILQGLALTTTVSGALSHTSPVDLQPAGNVLNVLNHHQKNHEIFIICNSLNGETLEYQIKMMSHLLTIFPQVKSGLIAQTSNDLWEVYRSQDNRESLESHDVSDKYLNLKGTYQWTGAIHYLINETASFKKPVWGIGYEFFELITSEAGINFMAEDIFLNQKHFDSGKSVNPYRVAG